MNGFDDHLLNLKLGSAAVAGQAADVRAANLYVQKVQALEDAMLAKYPEALGANGRFDQNKFFELAAANGDHKSIDFYDQHINVGRDEFEKGKLAAAQLANENLNHFELQMLAKYPNALDQYGQFNFEQFQRVASPVDRALYDSTVAESDRISSILGFSNLSSDAQASALAAIKRQATLPEPLSIEMLTSGRQLHLGRLPEGYENVTASDLSRVVTTVDKSFQTPADPELVKSIQDRILRINQPEEIAEIIRATDRAEQSSRVISARAGQLDSSHMAVVRNLDPERVVINNASLSEPYFRLAVNRHENVHVLTNSQGFADNARQYEIRSLPGEEIKFSSRSEDGGAYAQRFRADEIVAHMHQIATDTNTARVLLARSSTHAEAGTIIERNFTVLTQQNDFIKVANQSLDSAELALNSGAAVTFIGTLGDAKVARVPIELSNGSKYHIDFKVDRNISDTSELAASLHRQIQAARNDLANSARITAQQVEFNKALAEIHGGVINNSIALLKAHQS